MGHGNSDGSRLVRIRARENTRHWQRPLSVNPYATVPKSVMRQLASEQIATKEAYTRRLNELLSNQKELN
jgi:hypothetical protein